MGLKLYDMEWDVRDNVVEFIGALFQAVSSLGSIFHSLLRDPLCVWVCIQLLHFF
jgi:hypothetical protein